MKTTWIKGIKDKEIEKRIRNEFEGSRFLLDRLIVMLDEKSDISNKKIRDEGVYDKPKFEWYIADQLGYQRCLEDIKNLIKE